MKRVLITGKGSYIGTHFRDELLKYPNDYQVTEIDMVDGSWREHDFGQYDTVYHVAGLAHSTPDESQRALYYKVNTDLAYEVALKSKEDGVKQFIFMSSLIVYGSGTIGKDRIINKDTELTPDDFYGDSKKQAEIKIRPLESEDFKIVFVRPPMIYGPGCKGNYPMLSKFAKITPIFPTLKNQRSMLYLGNLVEFIKLMIDNDERGTFVPQNKEYIGTVQLTKEIAKLHNRKIIYLGIFNPFIKLLNKHPLVNKAFGNQMIDKELSEYKQDYNKYSFEESVRITEGK